MAVILPISSLVDALRSSVITPHSRDSTRTQAQEVAEDASKTRELWILNALSCI
jgi:hypothetical protein